MAFRLVPTSSPAKEHFKSKAAEGKPCPRVEDPCRWASCSLFVEKPLELLKLPRIRQRYGFLAALSLPRAKGRSVLLGTHVDFWRYAGVDPSAFVIAVEAI